MRESSSKPAAGFPGLQDVSKTLPNIMNPAPRFSATSTSPTECTDTPTLGKSSLPLSVMLGNDTHTVPTPRSLAMSVNPLMQNSVSYLAHILLMLSASAR